MSGHFFFFLFLQNCSYVRPTLAQISWPVKTLELWCSLKPGSDDPQYGQSKWHFSELYSAYSIHQVLYDLPYTSTAPET